MSNAGCRTNNGSSDNDSHRFDIIDEVNRTYRERLESFEEDGCTERVIETLKMWVNILAKKDKVLINTIVTLESKALEQVDKVNELCKDRMKILEQCEKYKKEMEEKTESITELRCRLKEQDDALSKKECDIKRLNEEINELRKCVGNIKNKVEVQSQDPSLSEIKCQLENLKKELIDKETKIKSLEEELCTCRQKCESIKDAPETATNGDFESAHMKELMNRLNQLESDINAKDERLQEFTTMINQLETQLESKSKELEMRKLDDIPYIEEDDRQLEYENAFNENLKASEKEIERLQTLLEEVKASGDANVETLKRNLENLKRESRDMKEALTTEVAEKHDIITSLRRDTAQLEDKARQADMQAIFKDDIIKELRKEVKLARAKESFIEMLGLNEGSRVQMKSKIDSLMAELEEKQCEISSLENKLEEMNRHTLEGKLGEISLQLMDRERDMIILCNKVDYIKRYLEKLHEDEDISIKCGLKALLLELNEETEWRRKARRSVTSLGDQPESVIIINRSNSLPAEPSEHMRYSGRVNELECKLERAKNEVFCLKRQLGSKDAEIFSLKESYFQSENEKKGDKMLLPDSMLTMKLNEIQKCMEESDKKLHESFAHIKKHAANLFLKEEIDEIICFLNQEQETFVKASERLYSLMCNIKESNPALANSSNYKLQCLEEKLNGAFQILDAERQPERTRCNKDHSDHNLVDVIISKIQECLKLVYDLKQDAPCPESTAPMSSANSIKLIGCILETIKNIQNLSKQQQSRLHATYDHQKEETGAMEKRISDVACLLKAHCKSINYAKEELKISLYDIKKQADKVRKQAETIAAFSCSVKDITNWANQHLKNNCEIKSKLDSLQTNLRQVIDMKNKLDKTINENQNVPKCVSPESSEFEDKWLMAKEVCDEINKLVGETACRISMREQKLAQMTKDINLFGSTVHRIQEDLECTTAHLMNDGNANCRVDSSYQDTMVHVQENVKKLLQAMCFMSHKLFNHIREADSYDMKGIETRKNITFKINELEETFCDLSAIIEEMKDKDCNKPKGAPSSESQMSGVDIQEVSDDSSCMQIHTNQGAPQNNLIEQMKAEICSLNHSIASLENQNSCNLKTIDTLKCQLKEAKEEGERLVQIMVSNLQEKCQSMDHLADNEIIVKLSEENKRLCQDIIVLKKNLQCKVNKISAMKQDYIQLTNEVNKLSSFIQQEKELWRNKECSLKQHDSQLLNIQAKYDALLSQHKDLQRNYCNMKEALQLISPGNTCAQKDNQHQLNRNASSCTSDETSFSSCGQTNSQSPEIQQLKDEIYKLNCENDRLNSEYEILSKDNQRLFNEIEELTCENQQVLKGQENLSKENNQLLNNAKSFEIVLEKLNGDIERLTKNNELLCLENGDLKTEMECLEAECSNIRDKFKDLLEEHQCLKEQHKKLMTEMEELRKNQCNKEQKMKILQDEEFRENMELEKRYKEVTAQLACAQYKIGELQDELRNAEERNKESAILEADTQLLTSKSDKEWNEIYVEKCAEVLTLTEKIECLGIEIEELNVKISKRNRMLNEQQVAITSLKKILQNNKTQIAYFREEFEKCVQCNTSLKSQVNKLKENIVFMRQVIETLNNEKCCLLDKLEKQQSEDCPDNDDSTC